MDLKELQVVEVKGIRTLTSKQLAECYGTTTDIIKKNFSRNRARYVEGKHYICFSGDELKEFKHEVTKSHPVNKQVTISALVGNRASHLYLWTEKGALLHAKSLNTDKAWEVYDYLVDFYFRAKEERKVPTTVETKPAPVQNVEQTTSRSMNFAKVKDPIKALSILLEVAEEKGIPVYSYPFKKYDSVLHQGCIGIRTDVTVEKACFELAYELSHAFIHYDGGDLIKSPMSMEYTKQAERAADMIMAMLNVKMSQA